MNVYLRIVLGTFIIVLLPILLGYFYVDNDEDRNKALAIRFFFGFPIAFFVMMTFLVITGVVVVEEQGVRKPDEIKLIVIENGKMREINLGDIDKIDVHESKSDAK